MLGPGYHRCDGCQKFFGPAETQLVLGMELCVTCFRKFRTDNPRPFTATTPDVPASEPDGDTK